MKSNKAALIGINYNDPLLLPSKLSNIGFSIELAEAYKLPLINLETLENSVTVFVTGDRSACMDDLIRTYKERFKNREPRRQRAYRNGIKNLLVSINFKGFKDLETPFKEVGEEILEDICEDRTERIMGGTEACSLYEYELYRSNKYLDLAGMINEYERAYFA